MIEFDPTFYLKIFVTILFSGLFLVCTVLMFKANRKYKNSFFVASAGSFFCIIYQIVFIINFPALSGFFDMIEALTLIPISLATLYFIKKFNY